MRRARTQPLEFLSAIFRNVFRHSDGVCRPGCDGWSLLFLSWLLAAPGTPLFRLPGRHEESPPPPPPKSADASKRNSHEVIQLTPLETQANGSESMTQQAKIAAALLRAGI